MSLKNINKNPILSLIKNSTEIPKIYMMVGLPASGKSTYADKLISEEDSDIIIHSSDKLRKELYGDENSQEHNAKLFVELHRRIKKDLHNGKSVIYDATNISKKRRIAFLSELKNIQCEKICLCLMTPYEYCLQFNGKRSRVVPEEAIKRMYLNWCPPAMNEGFDDIRLIYSPSAAEHTYSLSFLFLGDNGIDSFNQENSHHTLTLGEHCRKAYKYTKENNCSDVLSTAALLHDNGKIFTKTRINAKGIEDGNCHYYQHHCVGAYNSMFYTKQLGFTADESIYVANLIYYHMHPYLSWKQSERALKRDKTLIGNSMYEDIMILHEADVYAH